VTENDSIDRSDALTIHLIWNTAPDVDGHMYGVWMPAVLATVERNGINTGTSAKAPALPTLPPTPPSSMPLPLPQHQQQQHQQQQPQNVHTYTPPTHTPQQYQQQQHQQQHGRCY
jgi:hypothetical protein